FRFPSPPPGHDPPAAPAGAPPAAPAAPPQPPGGPPPARGAGGAGGARAPGPEMRGDGRAPRTSPGGQVRPGAGGTGDPRGGPGEGLGAPRAPTSPDVYPRFGGAWVVTPRIRASPGSDHPDLGVSISDPPRLGVWGSLSLIPPIGGPWLMIRFGGGPAPSTPPCPPPPPGHAPRNGTPKPPRGTELSLLKPPKTPLNSLSGPATPPCPHCGDGASLGPPPTHPRRPSGRVSAAGFAQIGAGIDRIGAGFAQIGAGIARIGAGFARIGAGFAPSAAGLARIAARWNQDSLEQKTVIPGMPTVIPPGLTREQERAYIGNGLGENPRLRGQRLEGQSLEFGVKTQGLGSEFGLQCHSSGFRVRIQDLGSELEV
ncbi:hypothetical protein DV515_00018356, partial [Chloebia gouldiae]